MATSTKMLLPIRKKFLHCLVALGFLNLANAPCQTAIAVLPYDLVCPPGDVLEKQSFFHDKSTFQSNEDQPTFWGMKGTHAIMRPKGRGARIMVSDLIDKKNGYLALTQQEYNQAKLSNPQIWMHARVLLEYEDAKEGTG